MVIILIYNAIHKLLIYTNRIKFDLRDFNPNSGKSFLLSYGLDDRRPPADVTIVGLYFADRGIDVETIQVQERLGQELEEMGITVQNAALNYYAPYSCAVEGIILKVITLPYLIIYYY